MMKRKVLTLEKFKIARLNTMTHIIGGTGGGPTYETENTQDSTDTNCTDDDPVTSDNGTTAPLTPKTPKCVQTSAVFLTHNPGQ